MAKKVRKPVYHPQLYQKPQIEPQEWKKQKLNEENVKVSTEVVESDIANENSQDSVINVDKDDPPTSSTVTPPTSLPSLPSSAFYPYVDPLHFFIDLRVGQIYDRKKETYLQQALNLKNTNNNALLDSSTWTNPIIGRNRANSAFKVPGEQTQNFNAINLIQSDAKKNYRKSDDEDFGNDKNEEVQIFDLDKNDK